MSEAEYDIPRAIVLNDDSFRDEGNVYYRPVYMVMFLESSPLPEKMIYDLGAPLEMLPGE